MDKNYAVHPGTIIKFILMSMNKTQKWLSDEIGMSKVIVSELINQKRNVSPAIALAIESATSYPALKLLQAQAEYDLYQERIKGTKNLKQKVVLSNDNNFYDSSNIKFFVNSKSTINLAS